MKWTKHIIPLLCFFYYYQYAESAKFLGIIFPLKGQVIETQNLLLGLADRGHDVYLVIGEHAAAELPEDMVDSKVQLLTFKTRSEGVLAFENPDIQKTAFMAFFEDPIEKIIPRKRLASEFMLRKMILTEYTEDMLKDRKFHQRIEDLGIDMVILSNCFSLFPTAYLLPYKHNLRHITLSFAPLPISGVPRLPSVIPHPLSPFSDDMSFLQRTLNLLICELVDWIWSTPRIPDRYFTEYLPGKARKTPGDLILLSELFVVTEKSAVLDYPQLTLPNVILAGGLNTRPGKPLTRELQSFMDSHEEGVIVVSFGSWTTYPPTHVTNKMLEAFSKVMYGVIWRFTGTKPDQVPSNVKLLKWLPQNDLLAHPNTKLFISHCGNGGSYDALYHGIPILGFPFFYDQVYNGNRARNKGMAKIMNIADFTSEELLNNIKDMIENPTYMTAAKKLSAIYRDQPVTSQQLAVSWIEHVLKHGGSYLRSPGAGMPWYQYYLVDVFIFLLCIVITVLILGIICCKCLCKLLSKKVKVLDKIKTN
ncbi:UDP-glucuronosyltransferase 2C1 [Lingula anatina]|uniref:UDP-glucuronosyltransferase n=1 Tax=Lingula anatina TaxID=7574 RepID=A0A2R2MJ14_LINAN|nr:UDP-glucuronosyltransferase 2C1 [Lingula anatina]|eukprot:XP_023930062.1 UDP-glucuronosyltransferase 2C1 [Lingula anatina]